MVPLVPALNEIPGSTGPTEKPVLVEAVEFAKPPESTPPNLLRDTCVNGSVSHRRTILFSLPSGPGLTTEPVPVRSRIRPLPDGKVITPLVCSIRCVDRHFQRHCRTNRSLRPLVPWSSSLFPSRSAK